MSGSSKAADGNRPSLKKVVISKSTASFDMSQLLAQALQCESQMVERTRALVEIESPSLDKDAVNEAVSKFAEWARLAGGDVRRHIHSNYGDSLEIRFGGQHHGEKPILLLGHLDTVWDKGTLKKMPWKVTQDRITGPGVLDMKAGVMMALTAIEIAQELQMLRRPIILLLHGDEEIGSPASRSLTESLAKHCSAVFVLEPAQGEIGAYKTARKAVGMYRLAVQGKAAHSGVDFESGHSAVVELARQIQTLAGFTDLNKGITVNPGLMSGGTRSNVVAAGAWVEVDVRLARKSDLARLDRAFHRLKPFDKSCKLDLSGGINRPPMERSPGTVALFRCAQAFAAQMGFELEEAATGGGSDGNFTASLGVPTLDGMGAVGLGAHAPHEHLLRKHLAPRTALLAAMLL